MLRFQIKALISDITNSFVDLISIVSGKEVTTIQLQTLKQFLLFGCNIALATSSVLPFQMIDIKSHF